MADLRARLKKAIQSSAIGRPDNSSIGSRRAKSKVNPIFRERSLVP